MSPYENVFIGNSFEEIVFSNRNREYGAYALRKKHNRNVLIAFLFASLFISASVISPLIYNHYKGHKTTYTSGGPVVVTMDSTLRIDPPKPPDIKVEQTASRFVIPNIVEKIDSTEPDGFSAMDDVLANNTNIDPPPTIENVPREEDHIFEIADPPFITVEVSATFKGGNLSDFTKWVLQNVKYPQIASDNGITGKVYIQFVVNSKGKVQDVTVLRGADPALDEEAVRVIKSSPEWTPPLQGGKPVKQLFSLPVNFRLE